jgi:hypothetical protein
VRSIKRTFIVDISTIFIIDIIIIRVKLDFENFLNSHKGSGKERRISSLNPRLGRVCGGRMGGDMVNTSKMNNGKIPKK